MIRIPATLKFFQAFFSQLHKAASLTAMIISAFISCFCVSDIPCILIAMRGKGL